jgi:hypothetical protein
MLPTIAAIGLSAMGVPAWGVGLGAGATAMLQGKSLTQGLVTGLLAGATAGVADSLAQAGQGAATTTALTDPTSVTSLARDAAANTAAQNATGQAVQSTLSDAAKTAALEGTTIPSDFAQQVAKGLDPNIAANARMAAYDAAPFGVNSTAATDAAARIQNSAAGPSFLPDAARQRLGNMSAGLGQEGALKNALMSKNGMAL